MKAKSFEAVVATFYIKSQGFQSLGPYKRSLAQEPYCTVSAEKYIDFKLQSGRYFSKQAIE